MKVKMQKATSRRIRIAAVTVGAALAVAGTTIWGCRNIKFRTSEHEASAERVKTNGYTVVLDTADLPDYGVGREGVLQYYIEGESPVPRWWDPEEPMAAEWVANNQQVAEFNEEAVFEDYEEEMVETEQVRYDAGCPDWNLNSTLWGWDGHTAEPWELDLFARVFYLEFWGTSLPCSEAGCDAILNLWDTGKYGRTLFEALSYYDPDYGYTYRVYPHVWETDYDPEGLAWCKAFCEERFYNGPEWEAVYFQLGGYHDTDWVPPLYEMDGVFFSGKGWK